MTSNSKEPKSPFFVSAESRVMIPLALLGSLLAACATAAGGWISIRTEVQQHTRQIESLQVEARDSRELLVRIDENVKVLKDSRR